MATYTPRICVCCSDSVMWPVSSSSTHPNPRCDDCRRYCHKSTRHPYTMKRNECEKERA